MYYHVTGLSLVSFIHHCGFPSTLNFAPYTQSRNGALSDDRDHHLYLRSPSEPDISIVLSLYSRWWDKGMSWPEGNLIWSRSPLSIGFSTILSLWPFQRDLHVDFRVSVEDKMENILCSRTVIILGRQGLWRDARFYISWLRPILLYPWPTITDDSRLGAKEVR